MRKYIFFVTILICIFGMLTGCEKSEKDTGGSSEIIEKEETVMYKSRAVTVDNLMDTLDWLGKSAKEIGIDVDEKEAVCKVKGKFLEKNASGDVGFADKNEKGEHIAGRVSLTVDECSLYDLYDKLLDVFSGPVEQGEVPYAESNGGAVEWYTFDTGNELIKISQGSKVDYVRVEISKNPTPHNTEKLVLRKMQDSDIATLPLEMILKVVAYDNGILTVAVTNQTGSNATFTDDYILAKSTDNGQTYAHLSKMGNMNRSNEEVKTHELADLEVRQLECDLRKFGKTQPGLYMIIIDDMRAEFQLIPESEDTGESATAPWFCPECGTKNQNTDVCVSCGAGINSDESKESRENTLDEKINPVSLEKVFSYPYETEEPYNEADYPDLAEKGTMDSIEIDHMGEGLSDYFYYGLSIPEKYEYSLQKDHLMQTIISDNEGNSAITSVFVYTGNPVFDSIMAKVGYADYELEYYYLYGIYDLEKGDIATPVTATLTVNETEYLYYFDENQLVRRCVNYDYQDNPKTNDFLNSLYKLGIYYGNVYVGERGRYDLIVMGLPQLSESQGKINYQCTINSMESPTYSFVLDENTHFAKNCDMQYFASYRAGEEPLDYVSRMIADAEADKEAENLALVGVWDMKITGNHIDYIYGIYWWD